MLPGRDFMHCGVRHDCVLYLLCLSLPLLFPFRPIKDHLISTVSFFSFYFSIFCKPHVLEVFFLKRLCSRMSSCVISAFYGSFYISASEAPVGFFPRGEDILLAFFVSSDRLQKAVLRFQLVFVIWLYSLWLFRPLYSPFYFTDSRFCSRNVLVLTSEF